MARDSKMEIIREGDLDEKLVYVKKKLLKGGIGVAIVNRLKKAASKVSS